MLLEINPNFQLMKQYCERADITGIIVFTRETMRRNSTVHMRHFAQAVGIEEITRIVVEQGYALKRPGIAYVHSHTCQKEILSASFGGQAGCTFEGRIMIP